MPHSNRTSRMIHTQSEQPCLVGVIVDGVQEQDDVRCAIGVKALLGMVTSTAPLELDAVLRDGHTRFQELDTRGRVSSLLRGRCFWYLPGR